jgi:hypothetical protein
MFQSVLSEKYLKVFRSLMDRNMNGHGCSKIQSLRSMRIKRFV